MYFLDRRSISYYYFCLYVCTILEFIINSYIEPQLAKKEGQKDVQHICTYVPARIELRARNDILILYRLTDREDLVLATNTTTNSGRAGDDNMKKLALAQLWRRRAAVAPASTPAEPLFRFTTNPAAPPSCAIDICSLSVLRGYQCAWMYDRCFGMLWPGDIMDHGAGVSGMQQYWLCCAVSTPCAAGPASVHPTTSSDHGLLILRLLVLVLVLVLFVSCSSYYSSCSCSCSSCSFTCFPFSCSCSFFRLLVLCCCSSCCS